MCIVFNIFCSLYFCYFFIDFYDWKRGGNGIFEKGSRSTEDGECGTSEEITVV